MSQTMNPNARRSMPGAPAPGMQLYDAPNCDYEPPKNFQQNFGEDPLLQRGNISTCPIGNPYDCPEGFYNGSMMSSQGYSQVHNSRKHKQNWFKYQVDLDMHQSNIVRCPTSCRRLPIMFLFSPPGIWLPSAPWHARPTTDDAPWTDLGTAGNDATGEMAQWSRRGGFGNFGVKFFYSFFCFLRPSHMHRGGKKCN